MSTSPYLPDEEQVRILERALERARKHGADEADALFVADRSVSAAVRLGEVESIERSEDRDLGLRVLIGRRQASASTTDLSDDAIDQLAERVAAMARIAPEDPYCGLADEGQFADPEAIADLDLHHPSDLDADELIDLALECEEAARAIDGVTNSEGAEAGRDEARTALATTRGFLGAKGGTGYSVGVAVLAGEGTGMEMDYAYHSARAFEDLEPVDVIGRRAGKRAVARLSPRRVPSGQVPIVYDRRVSASLVGHLAGAVNGAAVARGTSFLRDKMEQTVMAPVLSVVDDPRRIRGPASRPFDAEGVAATRLDIVRRGVLRNWVLDISSASQLGLETNGRAQRGVAGVPRPGTSNLFMQAGDVRVYDLLRDIDQGFLCTNLIGMGVDMVTGDYSRGASGFWIEDGRIAYPVSEITIAGNLKDMFRHMTPADDLEFRGAVNAPSVRIDGMTVAGN